MPALRCVSLRPQPSPAPVDVKGRRKPAWQRGPKTFLESIKRPHTNRLKVVKAKRIKGTHAAKDKRRQYLISAHVVKPKTAAKVREPVKAHAPKNARAAYEPVKAKGLKPAHKRRR